MLEADKTENRMEKKLFNFGVPWEHNISFSQGASVRGGRLILLSGQASIDDQGNVAGKGDMKLQVRTSLEAVKRALALVERHPPMWSSSMCTPPIAARSTKPSRFARPSFRSRIPLKHSLRLRA